ncbi:putative membrane protein YgcG [Nonomuraea dietziae]|uniref:Putative membrane protein YgcG n=1 Tax=Nonomuraea dietziae TaxID=65515 RepID=A0A7W5YNC7_9ACTN|nr:putative membrane protein YgcG [Nonomuraea dietziae]
MRPSTKVILTLMGAFVLFLTVSRDADGLWALSLGTFLTCLLIAFVFRDSSDGGARQGGSADRDGGAGYDGGGRNGDGGFGGGGDGGE